MKPNLKIGPMTYQVCLVAPDELPKEDNTHVAGEGRPDVCAILLNREYHFQQQRVTLFHEIVHVILSQAGRRYESDDEGLVESLAHGILQVLLDNPWLIENEK